MASVALGLGGGAFLAVVGWLLRRLVDQIDSNTKENKADLEHLKDRLDRHEAWHMVRGDHVDGE